MHLETMPVIRDLKSDEAEAVLRRNRIGRIAYAQHDRVDIEAIHYVYDAPWIYGRTGVGTKLLTLPKNAWCAFETDDVRGMFDWESVVVKGQFSSRDSRFVTWDYHRAVDSLRRLLPHALTDDDPSPHRNVVFGLHASEISGRCSIASGVFDGSLAPALRVIR